MTLRASFCGEWLASTCKDNTVRLFRISCNAGEPSNSEDTATTVPGSLSPSSVPGRHDSPKGAGTTALRSRCSVSVDLVREIGVTPETRSVAVADGLLVFPTSSTTIDGFDRRVFLKDSLPPRRGWGGVAISLV